jgi:NAD(P)-dependent dehydrogenase (short-subunit alcohol dehydrogenase family)
MGELDGKVVIVTGGSKGLGRGVSEAFAREGACVTVNAFSDEATARALVKQLEDEGHTAQVVMGDVSLASNCKRIVDATVAAYGGLDVLVNNAGIQPPSLYLNVEDLPEEDWDRIIDVNLKSYYLMSKYSIPEMRRRGGGAIIHMASVQGLQSQPLVPAYAASKGGILSLTRNMALDYATQNIRVLSICPGTFDTEMVRTAAKAAGGGAELIEQWGRGHPIGRIGRCEELANVALFLASDKASFMTGEYVCVDGGYMAQGAWVSGPGGTTQE